MSGTAMAFIASRVLAPLVNELTLGFVSRDTGGSLPQATGAGTSKRAGSSTPGILRTGRVAFVFKGSHQHMRWKKVNGAFWDRTYHRPV